jgi:hypothetical protein
MIAVSSALDLGDYGEAIRRFDAAIKADYRGVDQYPRSHAIYLARAAQAHLARHDLDAALARPSTPSAASAVSIPPARHPRSKTCAPASHRTPPLPQCATSWRPPAPSR